MPQDPFSALVVDDERNIRLTLATCLRGMGCHVQEAESAAEAIDQAAAGGLDVAFVDLRLGPASGLDLITPLLRESPHLAIIVITAFASIETAVEAVRRGAVDYLPKPFTPTQIRHVVDRVRNTHKMQRRVTELERRLSAEVPETDLAAASPRFRAALEIVRRAATSDAPVLLRGESGTGKGVLARALHHQSLRRERPFVTVSCPLLTAELLASELFGHVKGAFTGAVADRPGRIDEAQGGTLFLDEISEIPTALQAKLLRFVQERRYERVGDSATRNADVRLVAATNRDLLVEVQEGRFREDLFYRLNVVEIVVPPLRERQEDLVPLARRFLEFFASRAGRRQPTLSDSGLAALRNYDWPGNVRELRNTMERAVILGTDDVVDVAAQVRPRASPATPCAGDGITIQELEDAHVRSVVARATTLEEAAQILGIDPSTLWRKRRRLDCGGAFEDMPTSGGG